MKVRSLGHVVIKVRNQERSEAFYHGVLGMPIATRMEDEQMTFFSLGDNHHDFAIAELGEGANEPPLHAPGLDHVAFKIGDTIDELREAKARLDAHGVNAFAVDHEITQSLYCYDPDGNLIELYIDTSDAWKTDPAAIARSTAPLKL